MLFKMWLMKYASIGNDHRKEIFSLSAAWPGNFLAFLFRVVLLSFLFLPAKIFVESRKGLEAREI